MARMPTRSSPLLRFANGTIAKLETSRVANERKRGLRAVYADGVVEIDFLTRKVTQHHARARWARWKWAIPWANPWPVSSPPPGPGSTPLVTPEQAAQALETALWIEEASGRGSAACRLRRGAVSRRTALPLVPHSLPACRELRSETDGSA